MLARYNPGNAAVVKQKVNRLLYSNPAECKEMIRMLLNRQYRQQLSCPETSYSSEREVSDLEAVLSETLELSANK
jgi:hypothetical protein